MSARTILRWDHPPHDADTDIVDVPGVGRYMIKREGRGKRTFAVWLNNKRTTYNGSRAECHKAVEMIIAQRDMIESEQPNKEAYPPAGLNRTPRVVREHGEFPSPEHRDARIHNEAEEWTVTHKLGYGRAYHMTTNNFEWALRLAWQLREANQAVVLNAVHNGEAAIIAHPQGWLSAFERWRAREANKTTIVSHKGKTQRPGEVKRTERVPTNKG